MKWDNVVICCEIQFKISHMFELVIELFNDKNDKNKNNKNKNDKNDKDINLIEEQCELIGIDKKFSLPFFINFCWKQQNLFPFKIFFIDSNWNNKAYIFSEDYKAFDSLKDGTQNLIFFSPSGFKFHFPYLNIFTTNKIYSYVHNKEIDLQIVYKDIYFLKEEKQFEDYQSEFVEKQKVFFVPTYQFFYQLVTQYAASYDYIPKQKNNNQQNQVIIKLCCEVIFSCAVIFKMIATLNKKIKECDQEYNETEQYCLKFSIKHDLGRYYLVDDDDDCFRIKLLDRKNSFANNLIEIELQMYDQASQLIDSEYQKKNVYNFFCIVCDFLFQLVVFIANTGKENFCKLLQKGSFGDSNFFNIMPLDKDFQIRSIDYLWERIENELKNEVIKNELKDNSYELCITIRLNILMRLVLVAFDSIIIDHRKDKGQEVDGEIANVFIPQYCIFQQNNRNYRIHVFAKKSFDDVEKLKDNMLNNQYLSNFAQNLYQSLHFNVPYGNDQLKTFCYSEKSQIYFIRSLAERRYQNYTNQIETKEEIKDNNNDLNFFNQCDCDYLIEHELLNKYNYFIQALPEINKDDQIKFEGTRGQFDLINSISGDTFIKEYDLFFSFFDQNFIKSLKDPQTVQFIGSENYMRQIRAIKDIKDYNFDSEQLLLIKQMLNSRVNQMQVIRNEFINQHKEQKKQQQKDEDGNKEEQDLDNKHQQFINQYNIQYIYKDANIKKFHLDYRIYLLDDVGQIDFSFIGQQPLLNQYVNQFSEQQVNNLAHSDNFAFRQMILKPVQRTIFKALVYDMITYFYNNQNGYEMQSKFVWIRKDMQDLENKLIKELAKTKRREKEKQIEQELEILSKEEKALQNDKFILNILIQMIFAFIQNFNKACYISSLQYSIIIESIYYS